MLKTVALAVVVPVDITLAPVTTTAGAATQVTRAMHGRSPRVSKPIGRVFDRDSMVVRDFADGLASLKAVAER